MKRIILHSDFNSFYASVECMMHPEIAHLPVAVTGDPQARHGVVLAKNEIAKQYGIKTGETIWSAKRKCPDLHTVLPHFDEYRRISQEAFALYNSYTPRVEPFGLDECWLDMSAPGMTFSAAEEFANMLRKQIKSEMGLTVSVGVSFTKSFAKLASDLKKPDAVSVISDTDYTEKAWQLPCEALLYVGKSSRRKLNEHGIYTIGDIARMPQEIMRSILGKSGVMLHEYANGRDSSQVEYAAAAHDVKSVGNSTTTDHDLTTRDEVCAVIYSLADKVAGRLRKAELLCSTVQISVRDKNMVTTEKQIKLQSPSDISNEIAEAAMSLFDAHYSAEITPVRALGVHTTQLTSSGENHQTSLFEDVEKREKLSALDSARDKLRKKYGKSMVNRASDVNI
ncbi:MAG: DNA polymerase IV [Clostridia bacterium]|nr:DNA polymerase IV [Clostridia bacterium]